MVKSFADLGALGNYPGSPFLGSDSDILLDSPEQEDIGNLKLHLCPIFFLTMQILHLGRHMILYLNGMVISNSRGVFFLKKGEF